MNWEDRQQKLCGERKAENGQEEKQTSAEEINGT